jgi:hypothetical protein
VRRVGERAKATRAPARQQSSSGRAPRPAPSREAAPPTSRSAVGFASVPLFAPESAPDDSDAPAERDADRAVSDVFARLATGAGGPAVELERVAPRVQRAAMPGAGAAAGQGLIADDNARTLTTGQMRKSEFLAQLRVEACAAADRALAAVGRDTRGCPYVERWLGYYADKPAAHVERAIRKFSPEARAATNARDVVHTVAARVGQGARTWAITGQLPADLPDELKQQALAGPGAVASGVLGAIGSAIGSALSGIGRAIGSLFFKRDAGGRAGVDQAALSSQLGPGRPLDGGTRARMEGAFGHDFGRVRVHDDGGAARLSRDLDAHAFTLGEHVAFGAGNYRPGTTVGDALLAHELAHVVQQSGAARAPAPAPLAESKPHDAAEQDADRAAEGAVTSLYDRRRPSDGAAKKARPQKRTGLGLSRCGKKQPPAAKKTPAPTTTPTTATTTPTTAPTPPPAPVPEPVPAEDWKFTRADYARVKKTGKLTMAPDSSWFPSQLQQNLLNTLDFVFGSTISPPATEAVNEYDFFHGHVVFPKQSPTDKTPPAAGADLAAADTATIAAVTGAVGPINLNNRVRDGRGGYKLVSGYPFQSDAKGTAEEKIGKFKTALEASQPAVAKAMVDAAATPGSALMYHTFEFTNPTDAPTMGNENPRRHYVTPLDTNTPRQYTPPAGPGGYEQEWYTLSRFVFLIDKTGGVHVRTSPSGLSSFTTLELSTITGKPYPEPIDVDRTKLK